VLVVDDDDAMCRLLGRALDSFGCEAYQARAGPDVLALLRDRPMCAAIVSLSVPSLSGWPLLEALGEPKPGRRPATIAISADVRILNRAAELGVGATLLKPFSLQQLQAAIEGLLAQEGPPHLPTVPLLLSPVSAVQRSSGSHHWRRSLAAS
jgi:DNA-binding response OmpR family regulator